MNQLRKLIAALSPGQRFQIIAVAALVVAAVMYGARWRKESDFHPMYTSLSEQDAAAIVQKLKEAGIEYRISENGTSVLVPSAHVAESRLEMASAGLPRSGRIGFELFDKNNLGVTEFTEHVNYARALEGELERSIASLNEIEQARVHLTFPKDSVFIESKQPGKASVVLRLRAGAKLSGANVNAIVNLVAGAVEGLGPESISLVDSRGTLLNRPRKMADGDSQTSEALLEYRQKVESDLLTKINATLEPIVGAEKFRAGVSVDCDMTSGEQSEETVDPTKSVMLTSQKTEENTGAAALTGTPGTASNLPRPPTHSSSGSNGNSRRTENISYQTSRLVRHTKLPQGTVKRISVSVLIDHDLKWEGAPKKQKRVITAPDPERLKAIRELVSGVAGLNTERGDLLVVDSLPFEATLSAEPPSSEPAAPAPDSRVPKWLLPLFADPKYLVIASIAAILVPLILIVGVFMMMKKKRNGSAETATALPGNAQSTPQVSGDTDSDTQIEAPIVPQYKLPKVTTKKSEVLLKHIRESIEKDSSSTLNVLRTWLADVGASEPE